MSIYNQPMVNGSRIGVLAGKRHTLAARAVSTMAIIIALLVNHGVMASGLRANDSHASGTAVSDPADQAAISFNMQDALDAYYDAEKNALPATAFAGGAAAVIGGVLEHRKSRVARGAGIPLMVIGAATAIGSLAYWSQIDERHAFYATSLNQTPDLYRSQELEHLRKMQSNFTRTISIDAGATAAGLGLAIYGSAKSKSYLKGIGIGTLIGASVLTGLEMHNRDRSLKYLNALETFSASTSLEVGDDVRSLSLAYRARF